jgi:beta-barrel assembly-enhancing protease
MKNHSALWLAALTLSTAGCTSQQGAKARDAYESVSKGVAKVLISDEQEEQLGQQVHAELQKGTEQHPAIKLSTDEQINTYVNQLVNTLKPHADKDRKANWKVFVIDDPKTVNAFATPGAYIYVYTGLLNAADTESEVMGVMGHEMGHVTARHSARQLVAALGLNTVAQMALGKEPNQVAAIAASLVGNGTMLANSRADENEADEYAVRYTGAANYDATGIARFFQKLQGTQGNTPRFLTWLSTHPAPADRIARVEKMVQDQGLAGKGEVGAGRLDAIKARIAAGGGGAPAATPTTAR